jgi:hypothetical protein
MLLGYAAERGLKRRLIRTPFHAPRLSAYWVHMVTPIHWRTVLPLIEGLRANLIVHDDEARRLFPQIKPVDFRQAVREALGRVLSDVIETSWSDALVNSAGDTRPYHFDVEEGMMIERRYWFGVSPGRIPIRRRGGARLAVRGLGLGHSRLMDKAIGASASCAGGT